MGVAVGAGAGAALGGAQLEVQHLPVLRYRVRVQVLVRPAQNQSKKDEWGKNPDLKHMAEKWFSDAVCLPPGSGALSWMCPSPGRPPRPAPTAARHNGKSITQRLFNINQGLRSVRLDFRQGLVKR